MTLVPRPIDVPYPRSWRSLSRVDLDAGLNNSAAVRNSDEIVDGWTSRSALVRSEHPDYLDLRYGPRERNRIDFLKARDGAPTLFFIHGGYWQFRAKEHFAFAAAGPLAQGINVALIGYTLAPDASLDAIVSEIRDGLDFLVDRLPRTVADPGPIVAGGWSAGGHLAITALKHDKVAAALAISGVFDLEPIRHSYINDKLGLDSDAALRNSPVSWHDDSKKPVSLVVGTDELPLLREESAHYAAVRSLKRLPTTYEEIAGANHFTIMEEMARPCGRITTLVRRLLEDIRA